MKILIIEDEEVLVRVLKEKFEEENYKVSIARDGAGALMIARRNLPDMILLDIVLPKVNGLDVLEKLKSDDELQTIPVIMISNLGDDTKVKQALKLGAVDYMIKSQHPINEVVEKVNDHILKAR
jgi:DNA-binding response OmpR family regulator